jgi:hypothetical protein
MTKEGDRLRQRFKGHGVSSLARGHGRRRPDGSGRGCRVRALQVFDDRSARKAQMNAANRKCTKTRGMLVWSGTEGGGWWRDGLGREDGLCHKACQWRF